MDRRGQHQSQRSTGTTADARQGGLYGRGRQLQIFVALQVIHYIPLLLYTRFYNTAIASLIPHIKRRVPENHSMSYSSAGIVRPPKLMSLKRYASSVSLYMSVDLLLQVNVHCFK